MAQQLTDAFAGAAAAIRPSVVRIDVEIGRAEARVAQRGTPRGQAPPGIPGDSFERFFDFGGPGMPFAPPGPQRGTGSGILMEDRAQIVTNSHVVRGADKVTVTLVDGRKLSAKVVGTDPLTDIGVVRLEKPPRDLTMARLGDSDALRVGQWVLAVGSPLGLDQSVTAGIVSGLGRTGGRVQLSERVRGYIQTDAAINPGNSGGPLVTLAGEVVGINTLINVGPGGAYGFAIPIKQASAVARILIKEGRVRYPYIGVQVGDVDALPPEMKEQLGNRAPRDGAYVASVVPGGPAAKAGLRQGDIITKIGNQPVTGPNDVIDVLSGQKIGSRVTVEYLRDGKRQTAEATLEELPGDDPAQTPGREGRLGVGLQTLTEPLTGSLGIPAGTRGAVITDVAPRSPAAAAGLEPGDVIVEVDRKPVASAEEAAKLISAGGNKPQLLRITNARGARYVTVTPR